MSVAPDSGPTPLLVARGIAKRFGPTPALSGVDLVLQEREIHALVGPSGAGKSTLVNILSGLERYDAGAVVYRGYPIRLRSRKDAWRIGIGVAAQDAALAPDMSVLDNIILPAWRRAVQPAPEVLRQRAAGILAALGFAEALPLDRKASRLSVAQGRIVEVARVLVARAKLYLFDEPFAALGGREIDALIGVMSSLRISGSSIVVVGRSPDEILPIADRVTILCEGRTLAAQRADACDSIRPRGRTGVTEREERPPERRSPREPGRLAVRGLVGAPEVRGVSFEVGRGTVHALHGLQGAGLSAILETACGLRRRSGGTVVADGVAVHPTVRAAAAAGLALVTSDAAVPLPNATAGENLRFRANGTAGLWQPDELWHALDLPVEALDARVADQPAGVRRRIAIACGLFAGRTAVLLDEPTRGLDAAARIAVSATLRAAAARGCAVVATWSETDDLLATSDRVTVVREGRSVADLPVSLLDAEALGLLAAPAAAMARNTAVLTTLARENGGAAFWALRRDDHVLCLNAAVERTDADPGLAAACAYRFGETHIAEALSRGEPGFVAELDSRRTTVLVPIRTRRGQPMGVIGVTVSPSGRPPPAAAIAFHVEALAATL